MNIPEKEDILYAAEKLMPYMEHKAREHIEWLIRSIAKGETRPIELLDAVAAIGPYERAWMRAALLGETDERLLGFESVLPGNPNSIPAGTRWFCPICDFEWLVRKIGQPVPPCPKHKVALVLKD
jgi:hypothetical protein